MMAFNYQDIKPLDRPLVVIKREKEQRRIEERAKNIPFECPHYVDGKCDMSGEVCLK